MLEARSHNECPLLKAKPNKFKQKQAIRATYDEFGGSDEEDSENEEAMLCFMAVGEMSR